MCRHVCVCCVEAPLVVPRAASLSSIFDRGACVRTSPSTHHPVVVSCGSHTHLSLEIARFHTSKNSTNSRSCVCVLRQNVYFAAASAPRRNAHSCASSALISPSSPTPHIRPRCCCIPPFYYLSTQSHTCFPRSLRIALLPNKSKGTRGSLCLPLLDVVCISRVALVSIFSASAHTHADTLVCSSRCVVTHMCVHASSHCAALYSFPLGNTYTLVCLVCVLRACVDAPATHKERGMSPHTSTLC